MIHSNCIVCEDSISDPVCRECYIRQIEILLNDSQMHPLMEEIILDNLKEEFPTETLNITKCVLCGKENLILCGYCFSIILTRILRKFNFTEEMIGNLGYANPYEETALKKGYWKESHFF